MIYIADKNTDTLIYKMPNDIAACASIENIDADTLKKELQKYGYYADDADNIYTISNSKKTKPVKVLVYEKNGVKVYPSINNFLMQENLSYSELLKGVTPDGRKIEVLR